MIDGMMAERPILRLRAAVDAMGSVDASEFTDAGLAGEIRRVRREMDRMEAVFSELVVAGHRRGVGTLEGFQSTNAWLRARSGMRAGEVHAAIGAGEVSELLPETGSAWRDGEISSGAMHMIVNARVPGYDTEFQACEPELLKAARRGDLWLLSRLAAQIRLLARSEGKEPESRDGLRASVVGDRLVLDGELEGLAAETVNRALEVFTDPPSENDDRTPAQRRADGLVRVCRIALAAGIDANQASLSAAVVVDWATLLEHLSRPQNRSSATTDWSARLGGRMDGGFMGPIDPADVEALLCDCSISRVITGPDSLPINVGQASRAFPVAIRRANIARDQRCRWPRCEKPPGWCECHHVEYWEHGGDSSAANGVLLCSHHHHFVHRHPDWTVTFTDQQFRVFRADGVELVAVPDDPYAELELAGP